MLEVPIDRIMSVTDARNNFNKIVEDVENGEMYVLTKGGSPSVALISIQELEKLTGNKISEKPKAEPEVELEWVEETQEQKTPVSPEPIKPVQPSGQIKTNSNLGSTPATEPSAPQSFIQRGASSFTQGAVVPPLAGSNQAPEKLPANDSPQQVPQVSQASQPSFQTEQEDANELT